MRGTWWSTRLRCRHCWRHKDIPEVIVIMCMIGWNTRRSWRRGWFITWWQFRMRQSYSMFNVRRSYQKWIVRYSYNLGNRRLVLPSSARCSWRHSRSPGRSLTIIIYPKKTEISFRKLKKTKANILGIWKANICEPFAKTVGAAAGASRVLDKRVALGGWAELFRVQRGIVSREYRARLIFIWAHAPVFKMSNVYTVVWHHLPEHAQAIR